MSETGNIYRCVGPKYKQQMAIEACTAKTNHDRLHEEKSALLNRPTEASIKRPGGVRSWRFTRTETGWMRKALLGQKEAIGRYEAKIAGESKTEKNS